MSGKTKKVGSSGKFGPRYGMRVRRRWLEVDKKQRGYHECPSCRMMGVKRVASGIWECRKCGNKFTGGAYQPKSDVAQTVDRAIKRVREARGE